MTPLRFRSFLALPIENFIRLRQLSGTDYKSQSQLLYYFDRFLFEEKIEEPRLTLQITDRYLQTLSHLTPRGRYNRFSVVRQLCQHLCRTDPLTYVPDPIRTITSLEAHRAYIYSKAEIGALLVAASDLMPSNSLRPHTYKTLLGLLYSTGIRIGEALALNLEDYYSAEERLFIAEGKFHKARWVPLSASTCRALQSYLNRRIHIKPHSPDSPFFLNLRSQRMNYKTVGPTFQKLLNRCNIPQDEPVAPRIHDVRHTFATHRLLSWYRDGKDVNARLPWLATYMGHVNIESTQIYLQATQELIEKVAERFHEYYIQQIKYKGVKS